MKKYKIIIISSLIGIIFFSLSLFLEEKKIYFYLSGNQKIVLNIDDEYKEDGYKALYCTNYFKLFCKDITNKVVVKKQNDYKNNKLYLSYNIKHKNEEKIYFREIEYKDLESPSIELLDDDTSLCPNDEYEEKGYKAYDNVDGDLTDKVIIKRVDNKIYYSVTDSSNNKRIVYRTLKISDNEAPTITLKGAEKTYVFLDQTYNEKGYTAIDNCDGDVSSFVKINNNVNTSKPGNYKIDYSVQDTMGNKTTVSREIIVYDDISKIPKNGKVVYLTFDDGPCIYTEDIIKTLNKYNVKATFFVTNQFSNYQNIIKEEYDNGHTVAVHTFSHNYNLIYSSLDNYIDDFNKMNTIIYEQTGEYSNIFRFPGGSSNTISRFNRGIVTKIANKMTEDGNYYFDWNVDSNDTGTSDPNLIYKNVIDGIKNNQYSVVLMHDIKKANIESVEMIIEHGLENGYTFLPLDENSPIVHHKINN